MSDKTPEPLTPAEMMRTAFEPFQSLHSEMARMQHEVARMMEGFWGGAAGARAALPRGAALPAMRPAQPFAANAIAPMIGLPAADVFETADAFVISAELPGMDQDDVDVTAGENLLTIAGEKHEDKTDQRANFYSSERRYGRFQRSFPLPPNVQREKIEAAFKNGVLTVTLPKTADAKSASRKIEIQG